MIEYASLAVASKHLQVRTLGAKFLRCSVERTLPEEVPDEVIVALMQALRVRDRFVRAIEIKA